MPTLRSEAFNTLTTAIVEGDAIDAKVLEEAARLPDFKRRLRAKFYEMAATLRFSERSIETFYDCFKAEAHVDLSIFRTASDEEITRLVRKLRGAGVVRTLNLSNLTISGETLQMCLQGESSITALYLLGEVQLSLEDILNSRPRIDIYHHELLKRPIMDMSHGPQHPLQLLDFTQDSDSVQQLACVDFRRPFLEDQTSYLPTGLLNFSGIGFNGTHHVFRTDSCREPPFIARKMPLMNTTLRDARLVGGLKAFLNGYV